MVRADVFTDEEQEIEEQEAERFVTVVSMLLFEVTIDRTYRIYKIPAAPWPTDDDPMPYRLLKITDANDMIDLPLDNRREPRLIRAKDIAKDIIREWVNHGVFIARGAEPTKKELEAAHERRKTYFASKVSEADGWYESLQPLNRMQISDEHRRAARFLKTDRPWMYTVKTGQIVSCPGCGEDIREGIAICPHCRSILDPKKAKLLGHNVEVPEAVVAGKK